MKFKIVEQNGVYYIKRRILGIWIFEKYGYDDLSYRWDFSSIEEAERHINKYYIEPKNPFKVIKEFTI